MRQRGQPALAPAHLAPGRQRLAGVLPHPLPVHHALPHAHRLPRARQQAANLLRGQVVASPPSDAGRGLGVLRQRLRTAILFQNAHQRHRRDLHAPRGLGPVTRQQRLQTPLPHHGLPPLRVHPVHPVAQLLIHLAGLLVRPLPGLAQRRQLGHHPCVLPVKLRRHPVEHLRVVVRHLRADPLHTDAGVKQGLPQGIAISSRRLHRHPQRPPPPDRPQQSHERAQLLGVLHQPWPLERPVLPANHRQHRTLADVQPHLHGLTAPSLHHLLTLHLLDRLRPIRFASLHGDDLLYADPRLP